MFARFGLTQSIRTHDAFREAFATLAAMPHSGHERPDLDPPGRTFRYRSALGRFIMVYAPAPDSERGVRVARVLDDTQDLAAALRLDAGDDED